jgi:L-seryl-tRNA(Ser) seleniumtransferase
VADSLRDLPSVHEALEALPGRLRRFPRGLLTEEVRRAIDAARAQVRAGGGNSVRIVDRVEQSIAALLSDSLRPVINATGVVLHTNLGRAPLARFTPHFGYAALEYDLHSGKRGARDVHAGILLERLLGAPAIAVNNNAAAVYLALHELAAGYEVVVSRGELIEIGEGFRIPEIMRCAGAVLREVGTTNRTATEDYREAINERTRLLLRVHRSNFRIEGFTGRPALADLAALARDRRLPLYEDLGSGSLVDLRPFGLDEPVVAESLRAGAGLVSFSADKLLGGPQAGILAGTPELVARLRRNPMFRALRLDKLIHQSLAVTLRHILLEEWDAVPALRMIRQSKDELRRRAEAILTQVPGALLEGESVIGGGSTPGQPLPSWLVAVETPDPVETERRLRLGQPPVIARIERGRLLVDLRTVFPEEEPLLVAALRQARS